MPCHPILLSSMVSVFIWIRSRVDGECFGIQVALRMLNGVV